MLGTFEYMRYNGMLLPDVNPIVQLAVMYPMSAFGAIAPDFDHHEGSIPSRTPVALAFHKLLHLTNPKHRSWQTHSILVTGSFLLLLFAIVVYGSSTWGGTDWILIRMFVYGFTIGVLSHLVLDAMSTAGIWVYPGLKLRFVPHNSYFATGSTWEMLVKKVCVGLSILFGLSVLSGTVDFQLLTWMSEIGVNVYEHSFGSNEQI